MRFFSGYNREGYDREGYDREGYDRDGYDREGYDRDGYSRDGWNKKGINKYTGNKYDKRGYNISGYDKEGYNKKGYNKKGYDRDGYDKYGYDENGYDKYGYDVEGYDKGGYDREGYDREGYDRGGYDRGGRDKSGKNKLWNMTYYNNSLSGVHIFVFDVETTGLSDDAQILQFGGISGYIKNGQFIETDRINQYINVTVPIEDGAYATHHISKEVLEGYGYMDSYINDILHFFQEADLIVGHNVEFDINMIRKEFSRFGISYPEREYYDTMKASTNVLCIPRKNGEYKPPKLTELYYFLFHSYYDDAHDAMADVEATRDCLLQLNKLGWVQTEIARYCHSNEEDDDYLLQQYEDELTYGDNGNVVGDTDIQEYDEPYGSSPYDGDDYLVNNSDEGRDEYRHG